MRSNKYTFEISVVKHLLNKFKPCRKLDIRRFAQIYSRFQITDHSENTLLNFCIKYFGAGRLMYLRKYINKRYTRNTKLKQIVNNHFQEIKAICKDMGYNIYKLRMNN